jgi:hypothetical protein
VQTHHRNIGYWFLLLVAFVAAGFYVPYFAYFPRFAVPGANWLLHVHVVALLLWVALLVIQPLLIRNRRRSLHRALGIATYMLVPVIALTSIGVMAKQYREGEAAGLTAAANLASLYVSAGEILLFTIFYSLAVAWRKRIALHMRYMIATGLVLITPSLARVTGYWLGVNEYPSFVFSFVVIDALLLVLLWLDRREAAPLSYAPILALFLAFQLSWFAIGHPV